MPQKPRNFRRSEGATLIKPGFGKGLLDGIPNHTALGNRPFIVSAVYSKAHKLDVRSKTR
ncbi:MAG: hypothetical protein CL532_05360 [Aestuariivita sp.]|nr:hypothetical protein [Aestuariivita sp.]